MDGRGSALHIFHEPAIGSGPLPRWGGSWIDAGWSSPVARQAHNLKVVGSNPTPATKFRPLSQALSGLFHWESLRRVLWGSPPGRHRGPSRRHGSSPAISSVRLIELDRGCLPRRGYQG